MNRASHAAPRPPATRRFILLAALLLVAGPMAAWFLLRPAQPTREATVGTTVYGTLRLLQQEDAGWNADVLKSALGLDDNYDAVVGDVGRIDADFKALSALDAKGDAGLRSRVEILRGIFDQKAEAIETFKSHHSILRNSLRYVSTAADEARMLVDTEDRADGAGRAALRGALDAAASEALRYAIVSDEDHRSRLVGATRALDEAVARLPEAAKSKSQLLLVLSHLQTVQHQKPDVDALLRNILDTPTGKMLADAIGQADRQETRFTP